MRLATNRKECRNKEKCYHAEMMMMMIFLLINLVGLSMTIKVTSLVRVARQWKQRAASVRVDKFQARCQSLARSAQELTAMLSRRRRAAAPPPASPYDSPRAALKGDNCSHLGQLPYPIFTSVTWNSVILE